MKKFRVLAVILVFLMSIIGCSTKDSTNNNLSNYTGEAEILSDGTIVVYSFINQEIDGQELHAQLVKKYEKDDPDYQAIKQHIGDLKVGETKLVRPYNK